MIGTWRVRKLTNGCSWSALGGVLVTGVNAGGPPVMIWGWVGISCVSLCVAYSMAEMCSEYVRLAPLALFLLITRGISDSDIVRDSLLLVVNIPGFIFFRQRVSGDSSHI